VGPYTMCAYVDYYAGTVSVWCTKLSKAIMLLNLNNIIAILKILGIDFTQKLTILTKHALS